MSRLPSSLPSRRHMTSRARGLVNMRVVHTEIRLIDSTLPRSWAAPALCVSASLLPPGTTQRSSLQELEDDTRRGGQVLVGLQARHLTATGYRRLRPRRRR
jgi:hypothetical protein